MVQNRSSFIKDYFKNWDASAFVLWYFLLDGKLPVFYDSRSLKEQLMKYLGNEGLRQEKVRELQAMVLEHHTYDCRAEQLESILREERKL